MQQSKEERDVYWRKEIYAGCIGEKPLLPSFGDRQSDDNSIRIWNLYLGTASEIHPVPFPPASWKDGDDVSGKWEKGYQRLHVGEWLATDYNYFETHQSNCRIVAIPRLPLPVTSESRVGKEDVEQEIRDLGSSQPTDKDRIWALEKIVAIKESERKEWADMCIKKQARIDYLEKQLIKIAEGLSKL